MSLPPRMHDLESLEVDIDEQRAFDWVAMEESGLEPVLLHCGDRALVKVRTHAFPYSNLFRDSVLSDDQTDDDIARDLLFVRDRSCRVLWWLDVDDRWMAGQRGRVRRVRCLIF